MRKILIFQYSLMRTEKQLHLCEGRTGFWLRKSGAVMTCNNYPRVCRVGGSPGPDCCKKKCVNVMTDRLNCGMCGKKCKYAEICCKGKCVNPKSDKKNCGGCSNKCKKGSACQYGNVQLCIEIHECTYISTSSGTKQVEICSLNSICF
ncbi:hypothetical protein OIU85_027159 [Salix viminalis]|uniref:Stigma-specific STIG1-like protein 1 n=1 Tax=Salix viminalis TaxID=40686 RepID=A0A9Q0QI55_SALVM|nr:hypothetical protein OIU85_027159 [Salix viminalis]